MTVTFACPGCAYETEYRNRYSGLVFVFWHLYTQHPEKMFNAAWPLDDEEGWTEEDFQRAEREADTISTDSDA